MAIENKRLKRRLFRVFPVLAALVVLLVSLVLVSDVPEGADGHNRTWLWVLVLTVMALGMLSLAILFRFASLYRKVRAEEPGARLSARWVRNFLVLSLPPALIVYFVSAWFLSRTIDNWFDVEVEAALADSLHLGQSFLDQRTFDARNHLRRMADNLDAEDDPEDVHRNLLDNISASGPVELSILGPNGAVEATASFDPVSDLTDRPGDYALLQARERGEYAAAEPAGDDRLVIRVLRQLPATRPGGGIHLLQAIYPLPARISALTANIEEEYHRYQNVSYLRGWLKQSFLLILSLVLALTILLAILAALTAARRMVTPISSLAQATRRVAAGDLEQAVETHGRDEIGFLAQSFNDMTEALMKASRDAEQGRARLQAQGEYLETVLGSLSSGVLSLDAGGQLVSVNRAAGKILDLPPDDAIGLGLDDLGRWRHELEPLVDVVKRHMARGHSGWQEEILLERDARPLVLLVRGSRLPDSGQGDDGHVVVFDDVTVLNRAQRDAAWAEVARRLAHEVKNPLTPIRLAAERLRMKLMDRLEGRDAEMLDRSASTIVAQVEALRKLVDAFGDYAREPELERAPVLLDRLIDEVAELYRQADPRLELRLDLCDGPPGLSADSGQLRQLLHNLIRNAMEAATPGATPRIDIRTRVIERDDGAWLELRIRDNGPGFPDRVLEQPFEPYVTNKPGGSGLGLAICRKIVDDHDGTIGISNHDGGACAVLMLPLKPAGSSADRQTAAGDA